MNTKAFEVALNKGLSLGRWKSLNNWISKELSFSFRSDVENTKDFDRDICGKILALFGDPVFLHSSGSSNVIKILEYDWSSFSKDQKNELRSVLVNAYSKLADPLSWFLISEILGKYYADSQALEALKMLRRTITNDEARSLIPMGFEQIVRNAPEEVASTAFEELTQMRSDESEQVRMEVDISFDRLAP